jgi:hypothetical protein
MKKVRPSGFKGSRSMHDVGDGPALRDVLLWAQDLTIADAELDRILGRIVNCILVSSNARKGRVAKQYRSGGLGVHTSFLPLLSGAELVPEALLKIKRAS